MSYFNPRAPCGARQLIRFPDRYPNAFQSTRPVRGATLRKFASGDFQGISIHAPRAGRDGGGDGFADPALISIHAPRAGRDLRRYNICLLRPHFNPRAPCGARPPVRIAYIIFAVISIHAPRAGRDGVALPLLVLHPISIHAPRAGRDLALSSGDGVFSLFQSTRPVRGATRTTCLRKLRSLFQSTRPVRGATSRSYRIGWSAQISIHAPRAGRDGVPL